MTAGRSTAARPNGDDGRDAAPAHPAVRVRRDPRVRTDGGVDRDSDESGDSSVGPGDPPDGSAADRASAGTIAARAWAETTRPEFRRGPELLPGLIAAILFAVIATVVVRTPFGASEGFPEGVSIVAHIGYAMFDMHHLMAEGMTAEPFLVAFILVAILLDAALDASLVLAKREEGGEPVTALRSDADYGVGQSGDNRSPADTGATGATGTGDSSIASPDGGESG